MNASKHTDEEASVARNTIDRMFDKEQSIVLGIGVCSGRTLLKSYYSSK